MKILLIDPYEGQFSDVIEPLNLCSLAAYLEKEGHVVRIVPLQFTKDWESVVVEFKPNMIGVTSTTPTIPKAYSIGDRCKSMGITSVIGGPHVSVMSEEARQHFDIVVVGEGEKALLKIANEGIKEGTLRGEFLQTLDELPHPSRHLVDMQKYINSKKASTFNSAFGHLSKGDNLLTLMTSRGCSHNCHFCYNSWRTTPIRFNSVDWIMEDIHFLIDRYHATALFFTDDNFPVHRQRTKELCQRLIDEKLNLKWSVNARVDAVDKEILALMKEAGCQRVLFGFESGSQRILDILNKRTTIEQAEKAIKWCKEIGLKMVGDFMIGNPTETEEDIKMTEDFILRNKIDFVGIGIVTPFPGTKIWDMCKVKIDDSIYDKMTTDGIVVNLSEVSDERLLYWRKRITRKSWLQLSKIPYIIKGLQNPNVLIQKIRRVWK